MEVMMTIMTMTKDDDKSSHGAALHLKGKATVRFW